MEELALIYDLEFKAFPPRLQEQPIFYPVLNFEYAEQIARDWNTKSNSFVGYVARFSVDDTYINQFEKQVVGGSKHEEFWIPSEMLPEFNENITENIGVVNAYFGEAFVGYIPDAYCLRGKNALEQIRSLSIIFDYNGVDFFLEVLANSKSIFLNYRYWLQTKAELMGLSEKDKNRTLDAIADVWEEKRPEILLK